MAERDLSTLLRTLTVSRRPGRYCFVDTSDLPSGAVAFATVVEDEGTTAVVLVEDTADVDPRVIGAWLTLEATSDLAAVGLTAAVATCLAEEGISCNVLAGRLHDHLLGPEDMAAQAIAALDRLRLRLA